MTSIAVEIVDQLADCVVNTSIRDQREIQITGEVAETACENHHGICAICLNKILLQETALVKGCEHAYWFVKTIFPSLSLWTLILITMNYSTRMFFVNVVIFE